MEVICGKLYERILADIFKVDGVDLPIVLVDLLGVVRCESIVSYEDALTSPRPSRFFFLFFMHDCENSHKCAKRKRVNITQSKTRKKRFAKEV